MTKQLVKPIVFFSLLIFTISCEKKTAKTTEISGTISPVKAEYILLQKETDIERKIVEVIDTIQVDTKGNFNASYALDPYLYSLTLPNNENIALAIQKNQQISIAIKGYGTNNMSAEIKGSDDTSALQAYESFRIESLDRLVQSVRRDITELKKEEEPDIDKLANLGLLELTNYELHLQELNEYISKNMGTTLGLYATSIRWKGTKNLQLFDSWATNFENAHPTTEISKKLREKVTRLEQTAIGGQAANIKMNTVDGKQIDLSSIKSSFVLVDFWASWCGPCRRESAGLNEIYKKYTREQLDIYGVSLDDNREKWVAALEKDHRIWTNVSSLERFKTATAFDYAVTALPDNYLLDSNRKIIAKNLHGNDLEILLEKLMSK